MHEAVAIQRLRREEGVGEGSCGVLVTEGWGMGVPYVGV